MNGAGTGAIVIRHPPTSEAYTEKKTQNQVSLQYEMQVSL